jgi:hypothetical protein
MIKMEFKNIQKKLLKKTFKFTGYVWKSGLLDILIIFMFLIMLLFVMGQINFHAYQTEIFEENYATLLEDENIQDDFKSTLVDDYIGVLNSLIRAIIISLVAMVALLFIIETFIKVIQYRMLNTHIYKGFKQYIKIVLKTLLNTLPLFIGFWLIMFLLPIIFGFTTMVLILMVILFIFYLYALPMLRLCTIRHKKFSKSWKALFSLFKIRNALYFSTVTKTITLIVLAVSVILVFINNNYLTSNVLMGIITFIHMLFLILSLVFLRKFLFIATAYIELIKKK